MRLSSYSNISMILYILFMKIANTPAKATATLHVAKFKMLVTKLKLTKNDAVVEYFRETLSIPLQ